MIDSFEFQGADGRRLVGRIEAPSGRVRGWALFAHCFTCGKDNLAAVRIAPRAAARLRSGSAVHFICTRPRVNFRADIGGKNIRPRARRHGFPQNGILELRNLADVG